MQTEMTMEAWLSQRKPKVKGSTPKTRDSKRDIPPASRP